MGKIDALPEAALDRPAISLSLRIIYKHYCVSLIRLPRFQHAAALPPPIMFAGDVQTY